MLVLLEVVDLLVLAVGCADCLLAIANALLEEDTSRTLHVRTVSLTSFMHMLEVVRLRHSLGLTDHASSDVLILTCNALVRHICGSLPRLPDAKLEQLLDVLRRDLR